jgi:hypothetical protein
MEAYVVKTSELTVTWVLETLNKLEDNFDRVRADLDTRVTRFRTLQFARAKEISTEILANG